MHIVASNSVRYRSLLLKALLKRPQRGALSQSSVNAMLSNPSFTVNANAFSSYCKHFGLDESSVPATYLFVATQSELLQLFVHPETPIRPLGLVHTFVEFEVIEKLEVGQNYRFTVTLEMKEKTERGQRFETLGEFSLGGKTLARYRSGYLIPIKSSKSKRGGAVSVEDMSVYQHQTHLQTTKASTRAYASVSGDYNPIHLSGFMAKLFGFKAPIVHGMDMAGRLLSVANTQLGPNIKQCRFSFKRPVFVSQALDVVSGENQLYLVNQDGKTCVSMNCKVGGS
ncbi:MaoC family dehydratase [Vibrio maritimus]|uniref:MaoC family dehydratase n=1 Tax=Vibrio maritimus TaxID=990268 RepID=UPI004068B1EE